MNKLEHLVFRHETGIFARIILSIFGGFFIYMILKDFAFSPVLWTWSVFMLPFWIVTIGGLSVCVPLFLAGVCGPRIELVFNSEYGVVKKETELYFGVKFCALIPFSEIAKCEVARMDREDGPPSYQVFIQRKRFFFPIIDVQSYVREEDAQEVCDQIREALNL